MGDAALASRAIDHLIEAQSFPLPFLKCMDLWVPPGYPMSSNGLGTGASILTICLPASGGPRTHLPNLGPLLAEVLHHIPSSSLGIQSPDQHSVLATV